jgi:hypothetical protein
MGHVRKIEIDGATILELDYSDFKEVQMISLLDQAKEFALSENRSFLVLGCFYSNNYLTPAFMRQAEKVSSEILHLITKLALVGLNPTQKLILKGYNIFLQRNFKAFDSREEAIRYLLDKSTTDDDLPDYFKK